MWVWICRIGEADQVHCNVADQAFLIKNISNGATQSDQIHRWQTRLREEAPRIHKLCSLNSVKRSNELDVTIRLNEESYGRHRDMGWWAKRCCLNDTSDFAEALHVLFPSFEQTWLSHLDLLRQSLSYNFQQLLLNCLGHLDLSLPEFHHCFYGVYM